MGVLRITSHCGCIECWPSLDTVMQPAASRRELMLLTTCRQMGRLCLLSQLGALSGGAVEQRDGGSARGQSTIVNTKPQYKINDNPRGVQQEKDTQR